MTIAWNDGGDKTGNTARADCSTGSETTNFETAASATAGLLLAIFDGFTVHLESKTAAGTVAGGQSAFLRCYLRNSRTGSWNYAPGWDIPVPATAKHGYCLTFYPPPLLIGIPVGAHRDRIAFVPDGLTAAAGCYVDHVGT
jgi:hypothetical protein